MNDKYISGSRTGLLTTLRQMSAIERILIGLVLSALVAYYSPLLVAASFGAHAPLDFGIEFWIGVGIFMLVNAIGRKVKHIVIANLILAAVYDISNLVLILRQSPLSFLLHLGMFFFIPNAGLLINAVLFALYDRHIIEYSGSTSTRPFGANSGS